jgi:hypothetical protein
MPISSSSISEDSHDSVLTIISKKLADTVGKSSSSLLTMDLTLLKKIDGKFGLVTDLCKGI